MSPSSRTEYSWQVFWRGIWGSYRCSKVPNPIFNSTFWSKVSGISCVSHHTWMSSRTLLILILYHLHSFEISSFIFLLWWMGGRCKSHPCTNPVRNFKRSDGFLVLFRLPKVNARAAFSKFMVGLNHYHDQNKTNNSIKDAN